MNRKPIKPYTERKNWRRHWRKIKKRLKASPVVPDGRLPMIDLSVPWYRSTKFYRIAGISGAVAGGVLTFVPGFSPLGKIVAGLGASSYGIAEARRKVKGEDTWLGLLIDFLATVLKKLLKK